MKETQDDSLFAELTPEESASVNGGCYTYRNYYRPTRHVVYRRNCDGSFRRVIRYY